MGNASSIERPPQQQAASATDQFTSECPAAGTEQYASNTGAAHASDSPCPVPEQLRGGAVYNVYNQRMDGSSPSTGELKSYV